MLQIQVLGLLVRTEVTFFTLVLFTFCKCCILRCLVCIVLVVLCVLL